MLSFITFADLAMLLFYSSVLFIALKNFKRLFTPAFARDHRVMGLIYVSWLLFGLFLNSYHQTPAILHNNNSSHAKRMTSPDGWFFRRAFLANKSLAFLLFDIILGVFGISLTLSAAFGFKTAHARVKNKASGALDEDSTITYSEMIEHSFYQILNLLQAIFLHALYRVSLFKNRHSDDIFIRLGLWLVLTVLPWLTRSYFTTNSFSANYKDKSKAFQRVEGILYFIKKYQYAVLYKHFLFHGLNLTVALVGVTSFDMHHQRSHGNDNNEQLIMGLEEEISPRSSNTENKSIDHYGKYMSSLVLSDEWRRYWLVLNTAYTFEFFLQTLVKKGFMKQRTMLIMNVCLMAIGSAGAIPVLFYYSDWIVALISTYLNFNFRGHEVRNCLITMILAVLIFLYFTPGPMMQDYVCDLLAFDDEEGQQGNMMTWIVGLPLCCK